MADLTHITLEDVQTILSYDANTGIFIWRHRQNVDPVWNATFAGKQAGGLDGRGYRKVQVLGCGIKEHRLAWFYVYGVWPDGQIDHINRDKSDNRISNLRVVTNSENMRNLPPRKLNPRTLGVSYHRRDNRYRATITIKGVIKQLGAYKTFEEARAARMKAELDNFGEYSPIDYRRLRVARPS